MLWVLLFVVVDVVVVVGVVVCCVLFVVVVVVVCWLLCVAVVVVVACCWCCCVLQLSHLVLNKLTEPTMLSNLVMCDFYAKLKKNSPAAQKQMLDSLGRGGGAKNDHP